MLTRSWISLAHGRGTVTIKREGDEFVCDWLDRDGTLLQTARVPAIAEPERADGLVSTRPAGESHRDTKARCLGALGLLAHWPKLQAEARTELRRGGPVILEPRS